MATDCDCPDILDRCASEPAPCPDCTPCVVDPSTPVFAVFERLEAAIRCGWPADRCPPHSIAVEPAPQPTFEMKRSTLQIIPGAPTVAGRGGIDTWAATVVMLRPWATANTAGDVTPNARAARLETVARLADDWQIIRALITRGSCNHCGSAGGTIERVVKIQNSTTAGWGITVRLNQET